ncbi:uncharacterized protein MELLADRAFT_84351 [Melampsora larici-populina 98AG31]|uniref:Uncharacterized protein n=1 Tax=Melampsora larici-populina (strain 98AG31 / pathotype 3-4-7) TaxID=747676 RepID=F4RFF6_MELLP|nr:uncharacterized protein MELLADRAFT_84351 [Melampsora larici-populina 98AG31]EGG08800.1 hypothetical protein MELLADRAFT_84351 [Melampsora larici-populina 98AG31]
MSAVVVGRTPFESDDYEECLTKEASQVYYESTSPFETLEGPAKVNDSTWSQEKAYILCSNSNQQTYSTTSSKQQNQTRNYFAYQSTRDQPESNTKTPQKKNSLSSHVLTPQCQNTPPGSMNHDR